MLSVVIITKNEERLIETCLKSVMGLADEIIVADSGSIDQTLDIAKKYTNLIFSCKGDNFSVWRNEALEKAKGNWVLYLDADERIVAPLQHEIRQIIQDDNAKSAYAIARCNIIFGSEAKFGPFWPDWVIRLFKKRNLEKWVGKIHEQPQFKGSLGYLKNPLLHLTHRNLDQVVLKSLEWSKIDAKLRLDAGHPKITSWRLLRILLSELFHQGITRREFFGGTIGVIDALLQTFSLLITYIRLWEMQQDKPIDEIYQEIDQKLVKDNFEY